MSEETSPAAPTQPSPGWYDDGTGRQRWWDGSGWQMYAPEQQSVNVTVQAPAQAGYAGRKANKMPVSYTRQQKGHSIVLHVLLMCLVVGLWTVPYYSISPNHYWHI